MKIVITGSTGYIGRNILKKLEGSNHEVYVLVRSGSDIRNIKQYLKQERILNILDNYKLLYDMMNNIKPELLIHLSGKFISDHSSDDINELIDSNLVSAMNILDAVCMSGCKMIINTGSYWQNYNGDEYNPVNLYAATKEAFNKIIDYYVKCRDCRAITLKLFDTYGINDNRRKILNILDKLKDGEKIDMTYGEQLIYLCHIDDVVEAYIQAINQIVDFKGNFHKVYAVRDENPKKLKDIVNLYLKILNKKIYINWGGKEYREREIMDPTGIGNVLPNWKPKKSLEEGLIQSFQSQSNK